MRVVRVAWGQTWGQTLTASSSSFPHCPLQGASPPRDSPEKRLIHSLISGLFLLLLLLLLPSPCLPLLSHCVFHTHTHTGVVRGSELEAVLSNSATGGEQCHSQTFSSGCRTSVNCIISGIVLADTPANCSAYGHLLNHPIWDTFPHKNPRQSVFRNARAQRIHGSRWNSPQLGVVISTLLACSDYYGSMSRSGHSMAVR